MTATAKQIAMIHIAKKQLGLVDENYRAILVRLTGKDSSRDCSTEDLDRVIAEFKRLGWRAAAKPNATSDRPYVRKIYALWNEAGRVGAVENASKEALRAFVVRQTGKSAPEFLTPSEASKVSEALKAMIARRG
ncbi:gp16 family protein [Prosthecomicrobium hirschii]|uniref:gp16 family protein n=1 Tax=Prosthecodimorpha hirschii TaxID=665126 RepID=UPI00112A4249|nr:regulatory protein GemA [Prosthecomicrobium hirschii]MCW1842278.1 regulatory protein GemA [Prosthecomicrobium hirschii]TPQ53053.1 regulatory protein GemA [Prosthecomicrobium hirschii]